MRQSLRFFFFAVVLASLAVRITHPRGFRRFEVASTPPPAPVSAPAPPAPPAANPPAETLHAQFVAKQEARFHELQTRLHLNLDQQAAVRQAMLAEDRQNELLAQNTDSTKKDSLPAFDNQPMSVDKTLWKILSPDQAAIYEQMEADQEEADDRANARLEATAEVEQYGLLLNLTPEQKSQVYAALYQIQIDLRKASLSKLTDAKTPAFLPLEKAGSDAEEQALAKILTPSQLSEFHHYQSQIQQEVMKEFESTHSDAAL